MVLSSNSRSAEIPGTKGVTRSAFFEVGVLGSLRADRRDLYIGVLPIRSCLSTPALPLLCTATPPPTPTRKTYGSGGQLTLGGNPLGREGLSGLFSQTKIKPIALAPLCRGFLRSVSY